MYSKSPHLKGNEPSLQASGVILMIPHFSSPVPPISLYLAHFLYCFFPFHLKFVGFNLLFSPSVISYLWKIPFFPFFSPFFTVNSVLPVVASPVVIFLFPTLQYLLPSISLYTFSVLSAVSAFLSLDLPFHFLCLFTVLFVCFLFACFLGFGLAPWATRDLTFHYIQFWLIFQITLGPFPFLFALGSPFLSGSPLRKHPLNSSFSFCVMKEMGLNKTKYCIALFPSLSSCIFCTHPLTTLHNSEEKSQTRIIMSQMLISFPVASIFQLTSNTQKILFFDPIPTSSLC